MLRALVEGVGAIAAQAYLNPTYRDRAQELMQLGYTPTEIIAQLAIEDASHQWRQYGIVDLEGRVDSFTGSNADDEKGSRTGTVGDFVYSVQGNILVSQAVLDDMETAFRGTSGSLARRLMAALEAGDAAGGDARCTSYGKTALSAFITVLRPGDGASPYLDIDVPSTPAAAGSEDPIDTLRDEYDAWAATKAALLPKSKKGGCALSRGDSSGWSNAILGAALLGLLLATRRLVRTLPGQRRRCF